MKQHGILYGIPHFSSTEGVENYAHRVKGLLTNLGFDADQTAAITSFENVGLVIKAVLLAAKTHHYVKTNYPQLTELQIAHQAIQFYKEIYLTSQKLGMDYNSKIHRKVLQEQYFEFPDINPDMFLAMVMLTQKIYYILFDIPIIPQEE
jgi:hypothetical protein